MEVLKIAKQVFCWKTKNGNYSILMKMEKKLVYADENGKETTKMEKIL